MKKTERIITAKASMRLIPDDGMILDLITTGRYWRTSSIRSLSVITSMPETEQMHEDISTPVHAASRLQKSEQCTESTQAADTLCFKELTFTSEKESDEYDILVELAFLLSGIKTIITFNGNAFDLPHLHRKYEAYGLMDPLKNQTFRDLYIEYRSLASFFSLPGRHLEDYADALRASFPCSPSDDDAAKTLGILAFDSVLSFLDGEYSLKEACFDDALYYTLESKYEFPVKFSIHDETFALIAEHRTVRLCVHLSAGKLRVYHTDYKNYFYLPAEGYSVHRSMAEYVDKTRKEKAVRENCFHLVSYSDVFVHNRKQIDRYIESVIQYLKTR